MNTRTRYVLFFLSPSIILLSTIGLIPFIYVLYLSFHRYRMGSPEPVFVGLYNFWKIVNWELFWVSGWNTLVYALGSTLASLVIGLLLAIVLTGRFRGRLVLKTLLITPLFIPPVSVGLMWRFLLHPLLGLVPWVIKQLTGQTVAFFETGVSAMATLIMIDVWQWLPFMLLVIIAGIESLPREPFEAAMIDGASYGKIVTHVLLPLLKPVLVVAFLLKFLISLKVYDLIYTVTTGGPGRSTETLSYTIYLETFKYFWMGRGAAMALIFEYLVIVFGVIFVRYALVRGLRRAGE